MYHSNPCFYQGSFTEFCNGGSCSFNDYAISASSSSICNGDPSTISTTGGVNFYWSTGETSPSISVEPLQDTWYYVTLTTTSGCPRADSIFIEVLENPVASISGTDVGIVGGSDGTAAVAVTAGQSPYEYTWSNGASTSMIANLVAGTYICTVSDANACEDIVSIDISEPGCNSAGTSCDDGDPNTYNDLEDGNCNCTGTPCPTIISNLITTDVTCYGNSDGQASVLPTSGMAPYLINWSTGEIGTSISGLDAGTYSVTIIDVNSCQITEEFVIAEPPQIVTSISSVNESAPGESNGSIDLSVTGGITPYTYQWNTGATTEDISGLVGNNSTYSVTITDFAGCEAIATVTLQTECDPAGTPCDDRDPNTYNDIEDGNCNCAGTPCPTIISNLITTDVTCYGNSDGQASVLPTSGMDPYLINWSTGEIGTSISGLDAGTYSVTIIDVNSCQITEEFVIAEPPQIVTSISSVNESAPGESDGSIDLSVAGGITPYTYLWNTGATTEDISGLVGNNSTYSVAVTDFAGCQLVDQTVLFTACQIADTTYLTDTLCNGETILFYEQTIASAGIYYEVLINSEDCDSIIRLDVSQDHHPDYDALVQIYQSMGGQMWSDQTGWLTDCTPCAWYGIECDNDDRVEALSLEANNVIGILSSSLLELERLEYLNLRNNNITGNIPDFGPLPKLISLDLGKNMLTGPIPDGLGEVVSLRDLHLDQNMLEGPLPEALYQLSNLEVLKLNKNDLTGTISESIGNLSRLRALDLSFNDFSGQLPQGLTTITTLAELMIEHNAFISPYPPDIMTLCGQLEIYNFEQNNFFCDLDDYCAGDCQECISIGKMTDPAHCYTWEVDGLADDVTASTREVCVGDQSTYKLTVTDEEGNIISVCEYRFDGNCMASVQIIPDKYYLCGYQDRITLDAGAGYQSYQWSTGAKTQTISISEPGEYSVVVKDHGNCVAADLINIHLSDQESLGSQTILSCPNESITLIAPQHAREFLWNTGETTKEIMITPSNAAEVYTVTADGYGGCKEYASFVVLQRNVPNIQITASADKICLGQSIRLSVADQYITYNWYLDGEEIPVRGQHKSYVTAYHPGNYSVIVVDQNGCSFQAQIDIGLRAVPSLKITTTPAVVCQGNYVHLKVEGSFSSIFWKDDDGNSFFDNPLIYYPTATTNLTAFVSDEHGCKNSEQITVRTKPNPTITIDDEVSICAGESIELNASGSGSFQWSNGDIGPSTIVGPIQSTSYQVTLTDNGCSSSESVVVNVIRNQDPDNLKEYFLNQGFYVLPIDILGPAVTGRSATISIEDFAELQIKVEDEIVHPADELQAFLDQGLLTDQDAFGFITKNENFCAGNGGTLLTIIERDFRDAYAGFWLHLWEDPLDVQDVLFVKCNSTRENHFGPSSPEHIDFVNEDLQRIRDGVYTNPTLSQAEMILELLFFDLADSYLTDYADLLTGYANADFGCGTSSTAIFIAPSAIPFWLLANTAVNFRFRPEYGDLVPEGSVSAFIFSRSQEEIHYRGHVKDGNFGGYYCVSGSSQGEIYDQVVGATIFPDISTEGFSEVILGFDQGNEVFLADLSFKPQNVNRTTEGPFISNLESAGTVDGYPKIDAESIFTYELEPLEVLVREGQLITTNEKWFIDPKVDDYGGIFFRAYNSARGETEWIYGYYDYTFSAELTYLRWNYSLCKWQIFLPDRYPEFDPLLFVTAGIVSTVIYTFTEGKHDVLASLSLIPLFEAVPIPDLLDAVFYFLEGEKTEGFISLASALPILGWVKTPARFIAKIDGKTAAIVRFLDKVPYRYTEIVSEAFEKYDFTPIQSSKIRRISSIQFGCTPGLL